jgi:general secretion pathway protein C
MKLTALFIHRRSLLIQMTIIGFCSFLSARAVNQSFIPTYQSLESGKKPPRALRPPTSMKRKAPKREYQKIVERNIFDSANSLASVLQERGPIDSNRVLNQVGTRTTLDAHLLGTMVLTDPNQSIAVIEHKGTTGSYGIRETFADATLVRISRHRVEFYRNNQWEYLESDEAKAASESDESGSDLPRADRAGKGVVKKGDNQFEISKEKLEGALSDLNSILKQARAVPHIVNGVTEGFKIVAIRPDSIYKQLGIQNGDVIERVNGSEINSIESSLSLFQTLRNESNFTIDLKRRGEKLTYSYEVK